MSKIEWLVGADGTSGETWNPVTPRAGVAVTGGRARMRELLRVRIPGPPVGKGRPRVPRQGRAYTPKTTREWERKAATLIAAAWHGKPLQVPLNVAVIAVKARPKAFRKGYPDRLLRCTTPDEDNTAKAGRDALRKAGVYTDDCYVVSGDGSGSWYAAEGELPSVEIIVSVVLGMPWATGDGPRPALTTSPAQTP